MKLRQALLRKRRLAFGIIGAVIASGDNGLGTCEIALRFRLFHFGQRGFDGAQRQGRVLHDRRQIGICLRRKAGDRKNPGGKAERQRFGRRKDAGGEKYFRRRAISQPPHAARHAVGRIANAKPCGGHAKSRGFICQAQVAGQSEADAAAKADAAQQRDGRLEDCASAVSARSTMAS